MAQAETAFKQRDTRSGVSCPIDDSLDRESAAGRAFRARRGAAGWSGGPRLSDTVWLSVVVSRTETCQISV